MLLSTIITLTLSVLAGAFPFSKGNEYDKPKCEGMLLKKNHGNYLAIVRLRNDTKSVYVNPGFQSEWTQAWTEHGDMRNLCGGRLLGLIGGRGGCTEINVFGPPIRCLRFKKRHTFTGQ